MVRPKPLQLPVFPFLLPLFFVFHGYVENVSYISLRNCLGLLLSYLLIAAVLFLLLYLLYRDAKKAALAVAALQAVSFFFGPVQDLLDHYAGFLDKYVILLPALAILLVLWMTWLKKTSRRLTTMVLFINVLLLLYLFFDGAQVLFSGDAHRQRLQVATPFLQPVPPCDTCRYPDVYLLLMDEYAATASLNKWFNYDNSSLDSFLHDNRFRVQTRSHSNYNFTPFSMASILNMSYLEGLPADKAVTIYDYAACDNLVQNSSVVRQFINGGYDIINYSIFDLANKPSALNLHFLPLKANRISGQTLWSRLRRDFKINTAVLPLQAVKDQAYQLRDDNLRFIDQVEKQSQTASARPRFIYAHLEMPHYPHFYDRNGRLKEPGQLDRSISAYLDYLPYTNGMIKKMVTAIRQNSHDSAIIILMGDHGVRYAAPGDPGYLHDFENLNAVFFPDGDYHLWYDSISGVNQFRVVLNKLFRQKLPLLRDSVILLRDSP